MDGSLVVPQRQIVKISATTSSQLERAGPRYWAGLSSTPFTDAPTEALENGSNGAAAGSQPSLVAGVGDQCTNCGARLAPEQRYCVECGERRGQSRMPFAEAAGQRTAEASAPPPRKRSRMSPNAAMIAGIGTLILALGVGVLIGRSGNHGSSSKNPVQVIRVGGGTTAAAGAATAAASNHAKHAASKSKKSTAKKVAKLKHANPGAAIAGGKDAAKQHLPPPTVKVGQQGHGRGYTNGKFTGQFFGQ
jgi:hypothetical protein